MLFPYTYVPHQMEKMQTFIDFIFYEVWCKAPTRGPFGLQLFDANVELREVMEAFYYSDAKNADFFYGGIERIYGHFSKLKKKHIRRIKWWYRCSNDIESICKNTSGSYVACYSDIEKKYRNLFKDLKAFFAGLYDFEAAALTAKIGDIDSHYQAFVGENKKEKCPFCGIEGMKGQHHSRREAYDHYLPKALYPFSSINFHNLVPACHDCNSTYKGRKDPVHNAAGRRKAFNPYAMAGYTIEIQVNLKHTDIDSLTPEDIALQFGPVELAEEIETWRELYSIEERYKAKFCEESGGKYWLTQILDEWRGRGRCPNEYLESLGEHSNKHPYAECNFLKKPFLDACQRLGCFDMESAQSE
ncbi:hypothetical protein CO614_01015 [Lysobacteraceae bacterium NML120232]|nr:hypothetical protein CO614_01015 [Xanthomonadaceae bacterium NML120232]